VNILRLLQERAKDYDCSVCGTNHSKSKISVIGKREDAYVVRVVCSKCDTNITLLVYVGDKPATTVRSIQPKRAQRPPVTLDEVIDAHELLEGFNGAPSELFAPSGKVRSSTDAK
jgi:hypothetical protein